MKPTFKAIARAAGYRLVEEYRRISPLGTYHESEYRYQYRWYDPDPDVQYASPTLWHNSESDAWEDCCLYNKLVEDVE